MSSQSFSQVLAVNYFVSLMSEYNIALLAYTENTIQWRSLLYYILWAVLDNPLHYAFKSRKNPPLHKDLIPFENHLVKLMQNVTLRHTSNNFHDQMKADIESIKRSKNIFIFADKTNNLYKTDIKNYNKLLINNISKTYMKINSTIFNAINREAKNIAERYDIAERESCFAKSNAFVTLKYHKRISNQTQNIDWLIRPKVRLVKLVNFFITWFENKK